VTLGGTSPSVDSDSQRNTKRHPTLGDNVIVGSGAQILGPFKVGHCARIGANAVVTKEVPEGATIVGIPGRAVQTNRNVDSEKAPFVAYGTPTGNIPDPVARALEGLLDEVQSLRARVNELEGRGGEESSGNGLPMDRGVEGDERETGESKQAPHRRAFPGSPSRGRGTVRPVPSLVCVCRRRGIRVCGRSSPGGLSCSSAGW
jgi:serine O-acetyltransferase